MMHKILAFGDCNSPAYTSISDALRNLGQLYFKNEHQFKNVAVALDHYFENDFDAIVMPNPYGNKRRLAIYEKANLLRVPVIVFDRGGLPGTWFFDNGFNADSATYSPRLWDVPLNDDEKEFVISYLANFEKNESYLETQGEAKDKDQLRQTLNVPEGKKVILAVFQRPSDTTIKYFSGNARSFDQYVAEIELLTAHFSSKDSEWHVICKKHPLETSQSGIGLNYVPDDTNINSLLKLADAVVCVNSGVGLIASIFGKPVYHFGLTYYSHPKLNRSVRSYYDIAYELENNLMLVCSETRNRFLHYLLTKVYSIGTFTSDLKPQTDGSLRRITTHIDFSELRLPEIKKKKRCLFLTPVIPDINSRGSVSRTLQTLSEFLERDIYVDLCVLNRSEAGSTSSEIKQRLIQHFPRLAFVQVRKHPSFLKRSKKGSEKQLYLLSRLQYVFDFLLGRRLMIQNSDETPYSYARLAKKEVDSAKYDFVFVNYAKLTPPNIEYSNALKIVDSHDVQSIRMKNDVFSKYGPLWGKIAGAIYYRSEKRMLRKYDKVIAISSVEEEFFKNEMGLGEKVSTLNMAMDIEVDTSAMVVNRTNHNLLFVGSNSEANVNSLEWFFRHVWPNVFQKWPTANLLVIGRVGVNRRIKALLPDLEHTNIKFTTFVPDLEKSYRDAAIVVAPVVQGTGMKVKVVEALGFGKAVVGTSIAFDGIKVTSGKCGIVANSKEEFCAAIDSLFEDVDLLNSLARGARTLFEQNHSKVYSHRKFNEIAGFEHD